MQKIRKFSQANLKVETKGFLKIRKLFLSQCLPEAPPWLAPEGKIIDFWSKNPKNGPKTGFCTIFSRFACGNFLIFCIMIGNHDILKMMLK